MTRLQVETADAGSRAAAVTRRRLPAAFITIALVQAGESASTDNTPCTHTQTGKHLKCVVVVSTQTVMEH